MIIKGNHTPIISEEIFEKAQYKVKEIKKMYKPYYKPQYNYSSWLVGLCKCPTCGKSIVNSGGYFVCGDSVRGRCLTRTGIKKEKLEKLVLEKLKFDITNNAEIEENTFKNQKEKENEEEIATKLMLATDKLNRIKEAYRDGVDTLEEYKQNKTIISKEIENLKKEYEKSKENLKKEYGEDARNILREIYEELISDTNSETQKNEYAKKIIKTIVYNKEEQTLNIQYYHSVI